MSGFPRKIRSELLQGPVEAGTLADTNVEDILPQRPKAEERRPLPPRPQKSTKTIYITLGIFAILLVVAAFIGIPAHQQFDSGRRRGRSQSGRKNLSGSHGGS